MTQLLDAFGFISVLLRGLTLSFEALTVGGVIFLLAVARHVHATRTLTSFAGLLALTTICGTALNAAILVATTHMAWTDVDGAAFVIAGALIATGAAMVVVAARTRLVRIACPIACVFIVTGSVMNSHSFARLGHRWGAMALTWLHHLAGAAWIGGILYLLLTLRNTRDASEGAAIARRFSRLAIGSVAVLAAAGSALSILYVGSPPALSGTTYGIMLSAKVILTLVVLLLGGLNFRILRNAKSGVQPALLPLRRFAEAELGIGFTILLAAASLTSTAPAIDLQADLVTAPEIVERMKPRLPRLKTPSVNELSPATPLSIEESGTLPGSFVPGELWHPDTPADIAWSEYNHNWAGLIVAAIGVLALLARRFAWARVWPLAFLGLAVFVLIRADSENWPLGPRGFWESFQVAEVAQHRTFVLLIVLFAVFEWAVQTGRIRPNSPWQKQWTGSKNTPNAPGNTPKRGVFHRLSWAEGPSPTDGSVHCTDPYLIDCKLAARDGFVCPRFLPQAAKRAGLVFPLVCAAGGALLLTHSHSLGNVKSEYFAELSHIPLALFAVLAGWSRWLEIRLPCASRPPCVSRVWPACFVLIGAVLIIYREA